MNAYWAGVVQWFDMVSTSVQSTATKTANLVDRVGSGLSDTYAGFGDSFSSGFGLTSVLGQPSPTEYVRELLGANDAVDKSSGWYKAGELANDAWWLGLASAKAGDAISEAKAIKDIALASIENKPIPLWGNKIINIKIINDLSINFIDKETRFRFEIGYHSFGVKDVLFHININDIHYYPRWGWPPWGIR